jgi:hypothetical protein
MVRIVDVKEQTIDEAETYARLRPPVTREPYGLRSPEPGDN